MASAVCCCSNTAETGNQCLASVWACGRFEKYLVGFENFRLALVTDHKPLAPLMNKKDLDNVPIRCQRLLMRFKPTAEYAPGKTLTVADTLSRSPRQCMAEVTDTHSDTACYIAAVVNNIPATPQRLENMKAATAADSNLQMVLKYVKSGWPDYVADVPVAIRDYFPIRSELSEYNGIVTRGCRMIIPNPLRANILDRIHDGHQGLTKCRERANTSVWWPCMSSEINQKVQSWQQMDSNRKLLHSSWTLTLPHRHPMPVHRLQGMDSCSHGLSDWSNPWTDGLCEYERL